MPIADRLARIPSLYRLLRSARLAVGRLLPPAYYAEVGGRVHRNDVMMMAHTAADYRRIGEEAVDLFTRGLRAAGRDPSEVVRILDFGSGYGRVTRSLAERFGADRISVFDVDEHGPRFCAAELGVHAIAFDGNWDSIRFERYDAIWAGSVLTHLDRELTRLTVARIFGIVSPGGTVVVTTQGRDSLRRLRAGDYGPRLQSAAGDVEAGVAREGFAFLPYAHSAEGTLGMTWMSPESLDRIVGESTRAERVAFWPAAWDAHQDVHVFRAVRSMPPA